MCLFVRVCVALYARGDGVRCVIVLRVDTGSFVNYVTRNAALSSRSSFSDLVASRWFSAHFQFLLSSESRYVLPALGLRHA